MKQAKNIEEFEFRPRPLPAKGMPLGLRGAGFAITGESVVLQSEMTSYIWLCWCKEGHLIADIGGRDYIVGSRKLIFIETNTPCKVVVHNESSEFYWCCIDGDDAGEIAEKLGFESGIFDFGDIPEDTIKDWVEKLPSDSQRIERELSASAYELLYATAKDVKAKKIDPVFADIKKFITKNVENSSLTIDNIADYFGIHRSTLSAIFKKHSQMPAKDYLTHVRINRAEQLLTSTDEKISDIALMCGFRDPNYFSRMFRKVRGMTPREYRYALSVR